MGKHFRMSTRFHKVSARDFGLTPLECGELAVDPEDGTIWETCALFDFGWGRENGYFKHPLPDFDELLTIVVSGEDREDIYGAAAIILDRYPAELLESCEQVLATEDCDREARVLAEVFELQKGLNRSPTLGKSWDTIQKEARRWQAVADAARRRASIEEKRTKPFWKFWP